MNQVEPLMKLQALFTGAKATGELEFSAILCCLVDREDGSITDMCK